MSTPIEKPAQREALTRVKSHRVASKWFDGPLNRYLQSVLSENDEGRNSRRTARSSKRD